MPQRTKKDPHELSDNKEYGRKTLDAAHARKMSQEIHGSSAAQMRDKLKKSRFPCPYEYPCTACGSATALKMGCFVVECQVCNAKMTSNSSLSEYNGHRAGPLLALANWP